MTKDSKFGTFPKKWAKVLEHLHEDDTFINDVQGYSPAEIEKQIVNCNENIAEFKKNMDADLDLKAAKENVKELASQYTDAVKINEAKAMYCVYIKNSL